ncbi:MAG: hypothetical protein A4E56_03338 [Pelotomaculum sp. PtaU1.Bin065]|nr:MAG: hypothetical protein A4E56_03338 [Pelotomaculum sp. PtaU1.Bin065]
MPKIRVSISIEKELYEEAKLAAEEETYSFSLLVRKLLRDYIKASKKNRK